MVYDLDDHPAKCRRKGLEEGHDIMSNRPTLDIFGIEPYHLFEVDDITPPIDLPETYGPR